jgi:hypothetical protein
MLNVLRGVPLTDLVVVQPVQEHRDVSPRQSRNRLLRDWFGPHRRERLHVLQAPRRQTTHARELRSKIRREAIHDPAAPALGVQSDRSSGEVAAGAGGPGRCRPARSGHEPYGSARLARRIAGAPAEDHPCSAGGSGSRHPSWGNSNRCGRDAGLADRGCGWVAGDDASAVGWPGLGRSTLSAAGHRPECSPVERVSWRLRRDTAL